MFENTVKLYKNMFSEKEKTLLINGDLSVSIFMYSSGVHAVKVTNKRGYMTVLPFQGQQIWRAGFDRHELVMKNTFEEPQDTTSFFFTYGGFLIHCGLTAIGNPSPEDTHPIHGELPNARYQSACIESGEDERGRYVQISGTYEYDFGFEVRYHFTPHLRLYESETVINVKTDIQNMRGTPMEYLYLCHMNFAPVDGSRLVYSAKPDGVYTHYLVPDNLPEDKKAKLEKYFEALSEDVHIHDTVGGPEQFYMPEIVFTVTYEQDEQGRGYCMQLRPDGYADYVSHHPSQLPYGLRWIARTEDEDAMGMLLPATGEHNGYLDCRRKGYIRYLEPYSSTSFDFDVGILDPQRASALEDKIEKLCRQ